MVLEWSRGKDSWFRGATFALPRCGGLMNVTYRGQTYTVKTEACLLKLIDYLQQLDLDEQLAA